MFMIFLALFPKLSLSFRVVFLFFISLLYLFLLALLLHLIVLALSSYLLQMNIVLVACCNKLLTTNFVAYNRHVSSYSSEGDGPRISHQTQIKLWVGRFLLEAGQSLRPCLFRR